MKNLNLEELLEFFWNDYSSITPSAPKVHALLEARGEKIINDHIAFRTFNIDPIGVESLGSVFTALGYEPTGEYRFEEKKLRAISYAHPTPGMPHIFISELLTEEFSPELQRIVRELAAQIPAELKGSQELFTNIPTWSPISFESYRALIEESEYAGWLAAYGIRANHFTILVNALATFGSLEELNGWLEAEGFPLNASGGKVKGTPEVLLEQSSIMADWIEHGFADGRVERIRSCYYEFARRYQDPATGALYNGFIAKSADKIFESTNTYMVQN